MRFQRFKTPLMMAVLLWMLIPQLQAQTYVSVGLNQPPLLMASAGSDANICPGDSVTIGGNPTAIGGSGLGYGYTWSPNLPGLAGANPTISPTVTTEIFLILNDGSGCTAFDTVTVAVDTCVSIAHSRTVQLTVYPNPSNGIFRVEVQSTTTLEAMQLKVCDALGKTVFQAEAPVVNGNFRRDIDLSSLSRGVYFLRLQSGNQQVSQKLILR